MGRGRRHTKAEKRGSSHPRPTPSAGRRRVIPLIVLGALVLGAAAWFGRDTATADPAVARPADFDQLDPQLRAYLGDFIDQAEAAPRDARSHADLGLVYAANALWQEARLCFDSAATLTPDDPLPAYHAALAAYKQGFVAQALAEYQAVTERFPQFAPAFHRLGDLLIDHGDLDAAETAFRRVTELKPKLAHGYTGLGEVELMRRRFDRAERLLEKASKLSPRDRSIRHRLGLAYRGVGKRAEAEQSLRIGLDSRKRYMPDPWSSKMRQHKKLVADQISTSLRLMRAGRLAEAITLLEQAHHWHPDNIELMNNLASAYIEAKQPDRALVILQRAAAADDNAFFTQINLSACYTRMGRIEEALRHADRAIELSPTTSQAHASRAICLILLRRFPDARQSLETALRYDPKNAKLCTDLGSVCNELQDYAAGAVHFARAAELAPSLLQAHIGLCEMNIRLGRFGEARQALSRAQGLEPDDPRVVRLAKWIERNAR